MALAHKAPRMSEFSLGRGSSREGLGFRARHSAFKSRLSPCLAEWLQTRTPCHTQSLEESMYYGATTSGRSCFLPTSGCHCRPAVWLWTQSLQGFYVLLSKRGRGHIWVLPDAHISLPPAMLPLPLGNSIENLKIVLARGII